MATVAFRAAHRIVVGILEIHVLNSSRGIFGGIVFLVRHCYCFHFSSMLMLLHNDLILQNISRIEESLLAYCLFSPGSIFFFRTQYQLKLGSI